MNNLFLIVGFDKFGTILLIRMSYDCVFRSYLLFLPCMDYLNLNLIHNQPLLQIALIDLLLNTKDVRGTMHHVQTK